MGLEYVDVRSRLRRKNVAATQPLGADTEVVTVFHNPRCSKSRSALKILEAGSVKHDVVEYLVVPPSRQDLETIVSRLIDPVGELVRTSDEGFTALGLDPQEIQSASEVVDFLLVHPELMQRPVVVKGERAVIARPSERLAAVLD
jgi:arsenate reductase